MDDPRLMQKQIYGDREGPPMIYQATSSKPPRKTKRRKITPLDPPLAEILPEIKQRGRSVMMDETKLSTCDLPGDFPPELAYRALAAYSLLRTLSLPLRLSPFTPNVFLRALYLPYPNRIMGQVHVALLRMLFSQLQLGYSYKPRGHTLHKRRTVDNLRWPLQAGDNLTYLDGLSWPLFYDDYCHLTADQLYASYNDPDLHLDFRNVGMQPVGLENYRCDYAAFDDDDDSHEEIEATSRNFALGPSNYVPAMTAAQLQQLLQQQQQRQQSIPPVVAAPLGRGQRMGRNPGYARIQPSDSDSDYGGHNEEGGQEDDDAVAWMPKYRVPGRKRKRKAPTLPHSPASHVSSEGGSKAMDVEAAVRPSLDPATPTIKVAEPVATVASAGASSATIMNQRTGTEASAASNIPNNFHIKSTARTIGSTTSKAFSRRKLPLGKASLSKAPPMEAVTSTRSPIPVNKALSRSTLPVFHSHMPNSQSPAMQPQMHFLTMQHAHQQQQQRIQQQMAPMSSTAGGGLGKITGSSGVPPEFGIPPDGGGGTLNPMALAFIQQRQQHQQLMMVMQHAAELQSYPRKPSIQEFPPEPRRRQLEVDEDVAKALENFICGKEQEVTRGSAANDKDRASTSGNGDWKKRTSEQQWIHFEPIKKLREGVPYHRLAVQDKLSMLEFLIDELLMVDFIAAEFTKRQAVGDCYSEPYGTWPSEEEFDNLDNDDECGVCHGEGELLCCDGCVSSYHRACLDMTPKQQLLDGKWLCPECKLVDPALFGPLRGGRKASLDWFGVEDMEAAVKHQEMRCRLAQQRANNLALVNQMTNLDGDLRGSVVKQSVNGALGGAPMVGSAISLQGVAVLPDFSQARGIETSMTRRGDNLFVGDLSVRPRGLLLSETKYLIVHGFLFRKHPDTTIEDGAKEQQYFIVPKSEVLQTLAEIGPKLKMSWPFAQIPTMDASHFEHFRTAKHYLTQLESFDPNFYKSKYCKAPLSSAMKASGGAQIPDLMLLDYESQCHQNSAYRLSGNFQRDFTLDTFLARSLCRETVLFNPYEIAKGYMEKIEVLLRKACLMNEFWESGKDKSVSEAWLDHVKDAKSVNRLARLLLHLVDLAHPRAFSEGWFHNPLVKGYERTVDTDRHYEDLPSDWSEDKESKKRLWEKTPPELMLRLCEKEECALHGFVAGVREHVSRPLFVNRSKRKQSKPGTSTSKTEDESLSPSDEVRNSSKFEPMTTIPGAVGVKKEDHLAFGMATGPRHSIDTVISLGCTPNNISNFQDPSAATQVSANVTELSPFESRLPQRESQVLQKDADFVLDANPPVGDGKVVVEEIMLLDSQTRNGAILKNEDGIEKLHRGEDQQAPKEEVAYSKTVIKQQEIHSSMSGIIDPTASETGEESEKGENRCESRDLVEIESSIPGDQNNKLGFLIPTIDPSTFEELPSAQLSTAVTPNDVRSVEKAQFPAPNRREKDNGAYFAGGGNNELGAVDQVDFSKEDSGDVEKVAIPVADTVLGQNGDEKKAHARKKKSSSKPKSTTKGTRRRTRRSVGRFSSVTPEAPLAGMTGSVSESTTKRIRSDFGDMESQIEMLKLKKVPRIEKMVKGGFQKGIDWPICGRIPFSTVGNLPPREMRRLGRNSGVVKAPYVAYQTSHEVGQVAYAHVWRKKMEQCLSLEDLTLQIRVLESYLDRTTIHSCENVVRRGKNQIQKVVKITQRDAATGIVEHFVVHKGRMKGCWISSEQMDVSALILENFGRRQKQVARRSQYLKEKETELRKKREAERTRRVAELVKERARVAEEARVQLVEVNEKQEKKRAEAERTARISQLRAHEKARNVEAMHVAARNRHNAISHNALAAPPRSSSTQLGAVVSTGQEVGKWSQDLKGILMQHQMDMSTLMQACLLNGIFPVPPSSLDSLRKTTLARLSGAAQGLRARNIMSMNDDDLAKLVSSSESQIFPTMPNAFPSNMASNNVANYADRSVAQPLPVGRTILGGNTSNNTARQVPSPFQSHNASLMGGQTRSTSEPGASFSQQGNTSSQTMQTENDFDCIFDSPSPAPSSQPGGHNIAAHPVSHQEPSGHSGYSPQMPVNQHRRDRSGTMMGQNPPTMAQGNFQGYGNNGGGQSQASFEPMPMATSGLPVGQHHTGIQRQSQSAPSSVSHDYMQQAMQTTNNGFHDIYSQAIGQVLMRQPQQATARLPMHTYQQLSPSAQPSVQQYPQGQHQHQHQHQHQQPHALQGQLQQGQLQQQLEQLQRYQQHQQQQPPPNYYR